jgi:hypothetical protein
MTNVDPSRAPEQQGQEARTNLDQHVNADQTVHDASERITESERSGSITALGVLLGFSITILSGWSNRPEPWALVGAIPLSFFGSSVFLQVFALYRALQVPREFQAAHRKTIKLAIAGLIVMFVGFLSTIVIDVVGARQDKPPNSALQTGEAASQRFGLRVVEARTARG